MRLVCVFLFLFESILQTRGEDVQPLGSQGWKLWLDRKADWQNDALFAGPVDLSKVSVHPPTGGWDKLFANSLPPDQVNKILADSGLSMQVQIPGTVEEYFWNALSGNGKGLRESGDYVGVSWWGCDFTVPADAKGKRVKLYFAGGIRQRAEIFVNEKLVGYELIHQTPFEVDITDAVHRGEANHLAVRITDPNGNFGWGDGPGQLWGDFYFPMSHGFGGILGEVELKVVEPVHVNDVFVKNKPELTAVDADVEIVNECGSLLKGSITAEIVEAWQHNNPVKQPKTVWSHQAGSFEVAPGQSTKVNIPALVPEANLWEIRDANLYNFVVTLKDSQGKVIDHYTQRFGFRFLSVK